MHTFEFTASTFISDAPIAYDIHRADLSFEDENYVMFFKDVGDEIEPAELSVGDVLNLTYYMPDDVRTAFLNAYTKNAGAESFTFTLTI